MDVRILGLVPYQRALTLQQKLVAARQQDHINDTLLLLEHPPVITQGTRATARDLIAPSHLLASKGVAIHRIARGGETTYHGPGQLIGYYIVKLHQVRRVATLVHGVEDALIAFLHAECQITARRHNSQPGVWVGNQKIAAVGFAIQHAVTSHGFSLNISPNLAHYGWIVACGISRQHYTSVQEQHTPMSMKVARRRIVPHLQRAYSAYQTPTAE